MGCLADAVAEVQRLVRQETGTVSLMLIYMIISYDERETQMRDYPY